MLLSVCDRDPLAPSGPGKEQCSSPRVMAWGEGALERCPWLPPHACSCFFLTEMRFLRAASIS